MTLPFILQRKQLPVTLRLRPDDSQVPADRPSAAGRWLWLSAHGVRQADISRSVSVQLSRFDGFRNCFRNCAVTASALKKRMGSKGQEDG